MYIYTNIYTYIYACRGVWACVSTTVWDCASLQLSATVRHCNCVPLQLRVTATMRHCNCASLQLRVTTTMCHCNCASLQPCVPATVRHCNCASLQLRVTATACHGHCLQLSAVWKLHLLFCTAVQNRRRYEQNLFDFAHSIFDLALQLYICTAAIYMFLYI